MPQQTGAAPPPTPEQRLMRAVRENDLEEARQALAAGASPDSRNPNLEQKTALHFAAVRNHAQILELLLAKGANPDPADSAGETPLFCAAYRGRLESMKLLLAKGAKVDARTSSGWTPLMAAASEGHEQAVRLLLEKGASTTLKNAQGHTAAELAAKYNHAGVRALLAGANRKSR
jgi:ankyrin repeat protein